MLTHGAVHALELSGSPQQKALFLPRMVSGEWTGTMVLTEPHAGSDLGQVKAPRMFRTGRTTVSSARRSSSHWGDHDLTDNTHPHGVSDASRGRLRAVKGISLFIVPKFCQNADGSPRCCVDDVRCLSIEHKLEIKASSDYACSPSDNAGLAPRRS